MTDQARRERNAVMIAQCAPEVQRKFSATLSDMEGHGKRPRVQVAYRSLAEQARRVAAGQSLVHRGYHNVRTADLHPKSYAMDVVDDDHPYKEAPEWLDMLDRAARAHGLETGAHWKSLHDPWHVQVPAHILSIDQAFAGQSARWPEVE